MPYGTEEVVVIRPDPVTTRVGALGKRAPLPTMEMPVGLLLIDKNSDDFVDDADRQFCGTNTEVVAATETDERGQPSDLNGCRGGSGRRYRSSSQYRRRQSCQRRELRARKQFHVVSPDGGGSRSAGAWPSAPAGRYIPDATLRVTRHGVAGG